MAAEIKKISNAVKRIAAKTPVLADLVDPTTRANVLAKHGQNVNRAAVLAVKAKYEADKEAVDDMTMRLYTSQFDLYRNRALAEYEIRKSPFHCVMLRVDPQTSSLLTSYHAFLNDPGTPPEFIGRLPSQSFDGAPNTIQICGEFKPTGQAMENKAFYAVRMVNNSTKRYAFFVSYQAVDREKVGRGDMNAVEFGKNQFDIGNSVMVTEDDVYLTSSDGTKFRYVIPGRDVFEGNDKVQFNISSEIFNGIELAYNMYIIFIEK